MATDISHRLYYRKNNTPYSISSLTVAPSNGLGVRVAGVTRYFEATTSSTTNTVAFRKNNTTYYLKKDVAYISLEVDTYAPAVGAPKLSRLKTMNVYNTQGGFSSSITITVQRNGGSVLHPNYNDLSSITFQAGVTSTSTNMTFDTYTSNYTYRFKITIDSYTFYTDEKTIPTSGTTTYSANLI